MEHIITPLDGAFVLKQKIGLEKYKWVTKHKFLADLNGSLQYTKLWNSKGILEWFEWKILDEATNLLQWLLSSMHKTTRCIGPRRWQTCGKFFHGGPNSQKIGPRRRQGFAPWMEEGVQNLLIQIGSCGVLWFASTANVLPLLGGDN